MTLRQFSTIALVPILLSACTSYQYIPSHHYLNLHKQKGEVHVNLNTWPAGFQAGYSITDKFFVFGTAFNKQKNRKPYQSKEGSEYESHQGGSNEINLGVGLIHRKGKTVFDIMVGGGTGRMDYAHGVDVHGFLYNFSVKTRKNNFFIEPVVGWVLNETVEMGIFSRLNSVHYFHLTATSNSTKMQEADLAFLNSHEMNVLFFEPGVFFNIGWQNVKFNFQIGGSDEIRGPDMRNKSTLFRSGLSIKIGQTEKTQDSGL
jgi:hypothetical protein